MKKISATIIIIVLLMLSLTACFAKGNDSKAIITIKSDAIFELIVDEHGRVMSVSPLNSAAEVAMVGGLDVIDDTVSTAVRKMALELSKLGYINSINKDIFVDTLTLDEKDTKRYNRTIFNAIKSFNKSINVLAYDFKLEERDYRSFVRNSSGYENLELLQYRLITNIQRYRTDLTYRQGARMTIDELTQVLTEKYNFSAAFHSFTLAKWIEDNINAMKMEFGNDIAEILGGLFKQNYESFVALNTLTKTIIDNKLKEKLTIDNVKQALNCIGIISESDINQAYTSMSNNALGYPTIQSLEHYVDSVYMNNVFANSAAQENFEKQVDIAKKFYKLNSILLTEQEISDIIKVLPVSIFYQYSANLDTIEDVYYLLKILVEKSTSSYKLQYDTTGSEIKGQLDILIDKVSSASDNYVLEHKQLIDKEFERLNKEYKLREETYRK